MIVKLPYDGWRYFEGAEVQIKHGQSFLSNIEDGVICLIPNLPLKVTKDIGVTIIKVIDGQTTKTIFIPYNDKVNEIVGYLLNNEGKTIDRIN